MLIARHLSLVAGRPPLVAGGRAIAYMCDMDRVLNFQRFRLHGSSLMSRSRPSRRFA